MAPETYVWNRCDAYAKQQNSSNQAPRSTKSAVVMSALPGLRPGDLSVHPDPSLHHTGAPQCPWDTILLDLTFTPPQPPPSTPADDILQVTDNAVNHLHKYERVKLVMASENDNDGNKIPGQEIM